MHPLKKTSLMECLASSLRSGSRWLILSMIPLSVALWGGTRPWTAELIGWVLVLAMIFFVLSMIIPGERKSPERKLLIASLLILIPGWIMALNGHSGWASAGFPEYRSPSPLCLLPGSIDTALTFPVMTLTTGMLGALLICSDLASSKTWRIRFWQVLCLTGTGMVLLGIAQRLTGAQAIYWNLREYHGGFFFSVFRYHANAGAFINLIFPLTAGLAVRALLKRDFLGGVFWTSSLLMMLAASFVNVSRAAEAVTLFLMLIMAGCLAGMFSGRSLIASLPWIMAFLVLLTVFAASFGLEKSLGRWRPGRPAVSLEGGSFFNTDRGLTYRSVVFHLLPKTGFWGSGPGTFEPAFAAVVKANSLPVKGRWDLAHNDYLQTLSEWGVIPFLSFISLMFGAIWQGFRLWRLPRGSSVRLLGVCGALSLLGVLVHALVDFPLQIPSIQLCTAVICGILLGTPRSGSTPEEINALNVPWEEEREPEPR